MQPYQSLRLLPMVQAFKEFPEAKPHRLLGQLFGIEMNNRNIQRKDQAGHTKLTLVSIGHGRNKITAFVPLKHDADGKAVLPRSTLDTMLDDLHVRRGDAFTTG